MGRQRGCRDRACMPREAAGNGGMLSRTCRAGDASEGKARSASAGGGVGVGWCVLTCRTACPSRSALNPSSTSRAIPCAASLAWRPVAWA